MLTADELCDICGVSLAQRQAWAKDGDLRQRRGFEELDVIELVSYAELRSAVGPKRAKAAWRDLRSRLHQVLLQRHSRLWAVIEARGVPRHTIVVRASDLARRVEGGEPVVVVELRRRIEAVRATYRDATATQYSPGKTNVRRLRSNS